MFCNQSVSGRYFQGMFCDSLIVCVAFAYVHMCLEIILLFEEKKYAV